MKDDDLQFLVRETAAYVRQRQVERLSAAAWASVDRLLHTGYTMPKPPATLGDLLKDANRDG